MKLSRRLHKTRWGVLFASLLLAAGSSATRRPVAQTWGEAVNGLQMTIYIDHAESAQSKTPKFKVELRNASENDLILNLGMMLANGRKQYPNAIVLTLTDTQGKSRRLDLREPAGVAGRVDPFVLPLPVGATFSIPVDLDKYWAVTVQEFDNKLKPGNYLLEAQFTGKGVSQHLDVALMPYWTGTVTSSHLQFEIPNQ